MKNIITCTKCQTKLDVEQAIKEQLEKKFNADFTQKKTPLEKELNEFKRTRSG